MSRLGVTLLHWISRRYRSNQEKWDTANVQERRNNYAQWHFNRCVQSGVSFPIQGNVILEIGCGHGGMTVFLALAGAEKVIGVDIDTDSLIRAQEFIRGVEESLGAAKLSVELRECPAECLDIDDGSVDIIVAPNVF